MADYRSMYSILCVAASEAMDQIELGQADKGAAMLQKALYEAEDVYILWRTSRGRRLWRWVKTATPILFGFLILLSLIVLAFFWGGVVALHSVHFSM